MNYALLEKLCLCTGVSGFEEQVRKIITEEISPFAEKIEVTPLGNLIAYKKGRKIPANKLMLCAHMDEVGMTVTDIDDKGFLSFATVGGIDKAVLLGKTVVVNGLKGVIGGKPVHLMNGDEKEKAISVDELRIDIGAVSREDAQKFVGIGDIVSFPPFFERSHGRIKAKALDDRVGCLLLAELFKTELEYDTVFVFSVQEEVGLRGATTSANIVKPQIAIAVEGTVAGDINDVKGAKAVTKLAKGAAISIADGGTVYDREIFKLIFKIAEEKNIGCQPRTSTAGANDAGAMHKAGSGARAAALSVPCRYIHCPVSMADEGDIESAFKLLAELVKRVHD